MQYLNRPMTVKGFKLRNRLVMPPMATGGCDENGAVTQKLVDYYDEKTHGGYIGLVIAEHAFVSQEGMANKKQMSISRDSDVPGLKTLSDAIHKNDSVAVAQISHAGAASRKQDNGLDSVAPSKAPLPKGPEPNLELTVENIRVLVQKFADAARRAVAAGFDGVEIHSAHGYLLNQFYSPLTNKRTDEYGGDVMGRIKIHLEIIKAVREAIGKEKLLLIRLGGLDYGMEGGSTLEDAVTAAKAFEAAGVDILDISGGMSGTMVKGRESQQGFFTQETAVIRQNVGIPVIVTGGVKDAQAAEEILASGEADLVGVGRALLKDSDWAEKAMGSTI